jgi:hypothetical protein
MASGANCIWRAFSKVRSRPVKSSQFWSILVKSGQVWSSLVTSGQLGHVRSSPVKSGQVRSSLVKSGQVWLYIYKQKIILFAPTTIGYLVNNTVVTTPRPCGLGFISKLTYHKAPLHILISGRNAGPQPWLKIFITEREIVCSSGGRFIYPTPIFLS